MSKTIALSGMMGAGKNTVGSLVANRLGRGFVDVDRQLEVTIGMSIASFVSDNGMEAFRAAERTALEVCTRNDDMVIALGGGAILDDENIAHLQRASVIVWLEVPPSELAERLSGPEISRRPLLDGETPTDVLLAKLHDDRRDRYAETADVRVDGSGDPAAVAGRVLSAVATIEILTPSELESLL